MRMLMLRLKMSKDRVEVDLAGFYLLFSSLQHLVSFMVAGSMFGVFYFPLLSISISERGAPS